MAMDALAGSQPDAAAGADSVWIAGKLIIVEQ